MSASLPSVLSRVHNGLASLTEHSVCVYVSGDGVNFDVYPTATYGSSISDLSNVLPDLNARLAIQVSNVYIQQTIDSVSPLVGETELATGSSVRVVHNAQDLLYSTLHYQRAAFIRMDGSLVVWGDDEETTLASWNEIVSQVQIQTPTADLSVDTPSDVSNTEDFNVSLSILNELLFLPSFPDFSPLRSTDNFLYPSWHPWQEGSLGLNLQGAPSPSSDASTVDSPFTAYLESVPLSYLPPAVYVSEEEGSQALAIGQEATPNYEEAIYFPQHVNGSDAATANADVDRPSVPNTNMRKRSRSDIAVGSVPASLTVPLPYIDSFELGDEYVSRKLLAIAPALSPASPTLSSASTSASTPTLASAPMPLLRVPVPPVSPSPSSVSASTSTSSPAGPAPASASRRTPTRRATGNRRRAGGGAAAARSKSKKRFPCEYCHKTFSRLQDQQRHSTTSCNASPNRSTVDCPECGAILSRLDAAQRHWRGHENPSCAPPEWVSSGRF